MIKEIRATVDICGKWYEDQNQRDWEERSTEDMLKGSWLHCNTLQISQAIQLRAESELNFPWRTVNIVTQIES